LEHGASFLGFIGIGMLKQTEGKLDPQDAANGFVQHRFGHFAGTHQLSHVVVVEAADHVHVYASEKRLASDGGAVVPNAMRNEFRDRRVIAVHDSLKSPFSPQDLRQGERIGGGGHAIQ
jgi:hypothetical protein